MPKRKVIKKRTKYFSQARWRNILSSMKSTQAELDSIELKLKQKFTKPRSFATLGGLSGWEKQRNEFNAKKKKLRVRRKALKKHLILLETSKKREIEKDRKK